MSESKEMKWYVLHTYSAYENKVKTSIEKTIENVGMHDLIEKVVIPEKTVIEVKNGVERIKRKKILPGYVMVKMIVTDDTWYLVRNTKGVTGFVGTNSKPTPLSHEEVANMRLEEDVETNQATYDFEEGDRVIIISGPFMERSAIITSVMPEKKMVNAQITMFGKETDIELEITQVKKLLD